MHVQYCQTRNKQSQHEDLIHNTMYIDSPRLPDPRWPCYGKHYKGDYQNPQIAAKISFVIQSLLQIPPHFEDGVTLPGEIFVTFLLHLVFYACLSFWTLKLNLGLCRVMLCSPRCGI